MVPIASQSSTNPLQPPYRSRVCVVGLGFAGLPTAVAVATAGYTTIGLDIDLATVTAINEGRASSGVAASTIKALVETGSLAATTDFSVIEQARVVLISAPTPLDAEGKPDEGPITRACHTVLQHVTNGTLIIMQSTVVPGATRRLLVEPLTASGAIVGKDVFVASSPERVNPGDLVHNIGNTTKLVSGATDACLERGRDFVASFVSTVKPVASIEEAELAKLVENTFRFINISFANELALLCDRLGVSVWNVIEAASSKPFSFLAHYPGPGIGGSCIPVSPRYIQAIGEQHDFFTELVAAGFRTDDKMPEYVASKLAGLMTRQGRQLAGSRVLVVGLAYKPDVVDTRNSPALNIILALEAHGADVRVHDPLSLGIVVNNTFRPSVSLALDGPDGGHGANAAVVVTPHTCIDYTTLASGVDVVLDTRNALGELRLDNIVPL